MFGFFLSSSNLPPYPFEYTDQLTQLLTHMRSDLTCLLMHRSSSHNESSDCNMKINLLQLMVYMYNILSFS